MVQAHSLGLQPHIRAVPMALFPTMGSLQEVIDFADSKMPIINQNELKSLLFIMLNTVLAVQKQERDGQ